MKTVYISGAITGHDVDEVRLKFKEAQLKLIAKGYRVINPYQACVNFNEINPKKQLITWQDYMDYCLDVLLPKADIVALLPCWEHSKGAKIEKKIAEKSGFEVLLIEKLLK